MQLAVLIALLCFSVALPNSNAYASTSTDDLISEIKELVSERGGEILSEDELFKTLGISKNEAKIDKQLEFDSLEEFETFLNAGGIESVHLNSNDLSNHDQSILSNKKPFHRLNDNDFSISNYNSSHIWNRWSPIGYPDLLGPIGTTLTWKNISFNYSYKFVSGKPQFTSYSNLTSYISGVNTIQWIHRVGHANITTTVSSKDTLSFSATGNYYYGINVKGTIIGISTPRETWTGSLRLY